MKSHYTLLDRIPSLRTAGIGVERFPRFSNLLRDEWAHMHDVVEMVFVVDGTGTHVVGNEEFPFGPGALGIVHYEQTHIILAEEIHLINVYLDTENVCVPAVAAEFAAVLPRVLPLHRSLQHGRNRVLHLQFNPDEAAALSRILDGIAYEQEGTAPAAVAALRYWYSLLALMLCRQISSRAERTSHASASTLETIRSFIDQHCHEQLALDELAARCGFGKSYLCRSFKEYTGRTVFEYILQRRVEQAAARLIAGRDKVIDIAFDCGFNDVSHFNRIFKRTIGCSPTDYRKQQRA